MKKRYTEEQIIRILDEARDGQFIKEVCRKHNLSEATFYRWRKKYGDLDITELKRLKALEAENARLKRIVANQAIDIDALKDVLAKKW